MRTPDQLLSSILFSSRYAQKSRSGHPDSNNTEDDFWMHFLIEQSKCEKQGQKIVSENHRVLLFPWLGLLLPASELIKKARHLGSSAWNARKAIVQSSSLRLSQSSETYVSVFYKDHTCMDRLSICFVDLSIRILTRKLLPCYGSEIEVRFLCQQVIKWTLVINWLVIV